MERSAILEILAQECKSLDQSYQQFQHEKPKELGSWLLVIGHYLEVAKKEHVTQKGDPLVRLRMLTGMLVLCLEQQNVRPPLMEFLDPLPGPSQWPEYMRLGEPREPPVVKIIPGQSGEDHPRTVV